MNPTLEKLVNLARREVGVREGAVNNTGARIEAYQGATWLQPGAWPWCAAFTAWLMREWLEDETVRARRTGSSPSRATPTARGIVTAPPATGSG